MLIYYIINLSNRVRDARFCHFSSSQQRFLSWWSSVRRGSLGVWARISLSRARVTSQALEVVKSRGHALGFVSLTTRKEAWRFVVRTSAGRRSSVHVLLFFPISPSLPNSDHHFTTHWFNNHYLTLTISLSRHSSLNTQKNHFVKGCFFNEQAEDLPTMLIKKKLSQTNNT